jgi:saccharopine dehydrogenase (NAD+, L-lysine forming)
MKIGIIRERKIPSDCRVALSPKQCHYISELYPIDFVIEPSPNRCFSDDEYRKEGLFLSEDLSQCDVLLGVKEVPIDALIPDKTYFYFSHTIKKQVYNRNLLRAMLEKNIRMIDYEVLRDAYGARLIAFGHYAGIVGAHNALWTFGEKTKLFSLPRACESTDYDEIKTIYKSTVFPPIKICLTGNGRVANGAIDVLEDMGIREVSPSDFLKKTYTEAVFTQLHARHYVKNKKKLPFVKNEFYNHPERFESSFEPYTKVTDIFINGIFWNPLAPAFFSLEDAKKASFKIKVVADVTCDIAPGSSIPMTFHATTIADPVFGYHADNQTIVKPFLADTIDMMTIDNLPNELPRDASVFFGKQFIENILTELLNQESSGVIQGATICKNGKLTRFFDYLSDYVANEE